MWGAASAAWLLTLGMIAPPEQRPAVLPERVVWDVVRSQDGDIAFAMPAQPVAETQTRQGPAGLLEVLTYSCRFQGSHYQVQRSRAPQAIAPSRVIAELARLKKGYFGAQGRLVKQTPIVVDGVPGDDFTYTVPSRQGDGDVAKRSRHYIQGHSYYVLTITSPPGRPLPGDATRFLSSLTFEALVKAHYARIKAVPKPAAQPQGGAVRAAAKSVGRADQAATRSAGATPRPASRVELADSTPEGALKTFLLALAAGDAATLRAVSQPDDELDWLLRGRPAPPELLARLRAQLEEGPMKRLKAGDPVRMPGGGTRIIQPDDVREGRVVLWPIGAPLPSRLENVDGHWKIFARPFIAARKSAETRPESLPSKSSASPRAPPR
jgi:hypothetical protein